MRKFNFNDIESLPTEGAPAIKALAGLAAHLGYRHYNTVCLDDGSNIFDLIYMLEDNPGLIEVMYEWINDNYEQDEEQEDEEQEKEDC